MKEQIKEALRQAAILLYQQDGRKLGEEVTEEVRAELERDIDTTEAHGLMTWIIDCDLDAGGSIVAVYLFDDLLAAWKLV